MSWFISHATSAVISDTGHPRRYNQDFKAVLGFRQYSANLEDFVVGRSQGTVAHRIRILLRLAAAAVTAGVLLAPLPTRAAESWSLATLNQWRDSTNSVLNLPGVVFNDVDEVNGRLVVAVENPATQAEAVKSMLESNGVASAAIEIIQSGPARLAANLSSRHRPVVGGLQIQFQTGFLGLGTGTCTLGFPVRLLAPGQDSFITNSHCSRTQGSVDNGRYWSPTRPFTDGDQIGTEIADPAYVAGGTCPAGRRCRQSDAALVQSTEAGAVAMGTIARVNDGSITWNGTDRYQIRAKAGSPALGTVLTKVGRTTGRSAGPVTHSCVNINQEGSDITIMCEDIFRANVDFGDSGSPVFQVTNAATNDVALAGVLWGLTDIDGVRHAVYSYISGIEADLGGSLTVAFGS